MSPARSGSTFLEFMLTSHQDIVAVGETRQVINHLQHESLETFKSRVCSCGQEAKACSFWGGILDQFESLSELERLDLLLDRFQNLYPCKIMLDSSKTPQYIESYLGRRNEKKIGSIKVIFLIRDFRGWTHSIIKHRKMSGLNSVWDSSVFLNSYRWLFTTMRWLKKLKRFDLPYIVVFYENLIFDTKDTLNRIYNFMNIPDPVLKLNPIDVHELFGSPGMIDYPERGEGIIYDKSWMDEVSYSLMGPFLLPVLMINRKLSRY